MIAQKLRYYRAIQRLTQKDLADCCGWTPGAIGKMESRGSDVTLSVALKVAKALDVQVEDLVGDLTESQRDEMYIANQKVREARESRRSDQRKLLRKLKSTR